MKHIDGTQYRADDGKMLVRLSDGKVMGPGLDLGVGDGIANYEEREFTEEERASFWKSVGMEVPERRGRGAPEGGRPRHDA